MRTENEILEILLREGAQVLCCSNCGKKLNDAIEESYENETPIAVLYFEREEYNYPQAPDIPPTLYFECMECLKERKKNE